MSKEYYKGIDKIKFEGKDSDNPLAYKFYDASKMAVSYTHLTLPTSDLV